MFVVTGGAGFIGSHLIKALEDRYPTQKIVLADVFGSDQKWQNIAKRNLWDIVRPENLLNYLSDKKNNKIKAIFHLGAISSTVEEDVDLIISQNITFSGALWDWCTQSQVPLLYASSAATYGNGTEGFSDGNDLSDLRRLRPLNPYGWSKHAFDLKAIQMGAEKYAPPQWVGFKFFNVYGPNEYHKGGQKSVVATLFPSIQEQGRARLFKSTDKKYEDGGQLRDFIYVQDCVSVMLWFYENSQTSGIFNVGTGRARSFKDLAVSVFKALDKTPNIEYFDMPDTLRDKYQNFTEADLTNLRRVGYTRPFTALEEGVKTYVQQFLLKPDIYL